MFNIIKNTGTVSDVPSYVRSPIWYRIGQLYGGRVARSQLKYWMRPPAMLVPAKLVVQHTSQGQPPGTGLTPVFTVANVQGDTFTNVPNAVIQVLNNSGVAVTVFVIGEQSCNQGYFHNYVQTIQTGTGTPVEIGPFDFHYNDPAALVHITYSFNGRIVPGVTVAIVAP